MTDFVDKPEEPLKVPGIEFSKPLDKYVKGFFIKYKDEKTGRVKRQRITKQQLRFVEYLMQGYKPTEAAAKSGYAKNPSAASHLMKTKVVKGLAMTLAHKFENAGITMDFITLKMKEWFDAKKTVRSKTGETIGEDPDYDTQIKAYDRWKDTVAPGGQRGGSAGKKLTYEEWVMED